MVKNSAVPTSTYRCDAVLLTIPAGCFVDLNGLDRVDQPSAAGEMRRTRTARFRLLPSVLCRRGSMALASEQTCRQPGLETQADVVH